MTIRAAINGFGRIGRLVLRAVVEMKRDEFEIVAVNDLAPVEMNAHLLRHDTVHGAFPGNVGVSDGALQVDGRAIRALSESDPDALPWHDLGVDVVLECSGAFRRREDAARHLAVGAKQVLISAPAKGQGADLTVVYGVNHDRLRPDFTIVSNASCTTNAVAPLVHVLHQAFGIEHACMLTAHGYTASQRLVDGWHKDPRRARAAAANMIPTSTGAAKAVGEVLPDLAGRVVGSALRVPLTNMSIVYLTFETRRATTADAVNQAMREAADGDLSGVLSVSDDPLVSSDFVHDPHSAILDAPSTLMAGPIMGMIAAWYDNEWGFAVRLLDTAREMARVARG